MSEKLLTDRQLVKQFQRGSLEAFDVFIRRHQDRLMRLALVTLYSQASVEDAVQEVFLRSLKGLSRFRFNAEPFTWLYRCLQNVCQEMNRQLNNNQQRNTGQTPDQTEETSNVSERADWQIDNRNRINQVKKLVSALPNQQREVVILRIFEELSVTQTANIMGCREGTVKAHLHKALANLKQSPMVKQLREEFNYE